MNLESKDLHADTLWKEFEALVKPNADLPDLAFTNRFEKGVPLYDGNELRPLLTTRRRGALLGEWADVLSAGPGVLVIQGAYADLQAIDDATGIFNQIIADEKAANGGGADHFAKGGSNDRIWNALQKLCEASPDVFARYFGNEVIAAVCESWLGPGYQMTAQINLVRPGGAAQAPHRDYHLGFQRAEAAAAFPAHVHAMSPCLTLQGAVAHTDMPVESGPTKLLPHSQKFSAGYVKASASQYRDHFEAHCIQLPLQKGDAVFFSPALFHAAGENRSADIQRTANLLQVSSPFGRAMESVDRLKMSLALFPVLRRGLDEKTLRWSEVCAAIASSAEGYAFPTNLDLDPPVDGLAPQTQQDVLLRALEENWTQPRFFEALRARESSRQP